jgi:hypothetical protein
MKRIADLLSKNACRFACLSAFVFLSILRAQEPYPPANRLPALSGYPDPLVTFGGKAVRTPEDWFSIRRPELKALFQYYMYGTIPPPPDGLRFVTRRVNPRALDGKATLKQIDLRLGAGPAPIIHLMLVVPNGKAGPFPVFVGPNFSGNHTLLPDTDVIVTEAWLYDGYPGVVDHRATTAGRGGCKDTWSIEQILDRGYAVATFYNGDVEPDDPSLRDGIRFRLPGKARDDSDQHGLGTVAAWAWGVHRAVDYLVTDKDIDAGRIAVVGHSRNGKAALVAAAFDERIVLAIPHQAGCGGTAPSRGTIGESVKQINERFPHWFCRTFHEFNDCPERLPFDQHCLIALTAPRPVLLTNAVEDSWANPDGQFDMLEAADPVYRFLGVDGMESSRTPEVGKLMNSRLGYFIRPGKHSMTPEDWKVFLDFADKNMKPVEGRVK